MPKQICTDYELFFKFQAIGITQKFNICVTKKIRNETLYWDRTISAQSSKLNKFGKNYTVSSI